MLVRQLPVKRPALADGSERMVVSVYDLVLANYGLDRGLDDCHSANNYNDVKAYTPAWGEQITGVPRRHIETIAREFAETAHKTHGRSMIILGAGVNHWYHMDMNYRGMINMLVFCGCVGQTGGGWAHYVGREAAAANRLAAAGLRAGLESPAASDEQYLVFLQPCQPVAL